MSFSILILLGLGFAIFFFATQSLETKRTVVVEILDFPDGKTVTVREGVKTYNAYLAGVGYPTDDPRSEMDACQRLRDIAIGKRLEMIIHKEVDQIQYVELSAGDGDSLNRMLLRFGMARLELRGMGSLPEFFNAEIEAKSQMLGIWDINRDVFKTMGIDGEGEEGESSETAMDIQDEIAEEFGDVSVSSDGVTEGDFKDLHS